MVEKVKECKVRIVLEGARQFIKQVKEIRREFELLREEVEQLNMALENTDELLGKLRR